MMLYQEIRLGCNTYHQRHQYSYDKSYASYIEDKNQTKWDNPDRLDTDEVKRLVRFVNQWGTMMPKNDETIRRLLNNMTIAVPQLNKLRNNTLLDVNFDETTKRMIEECFTAIAGSAVKKGGVKVTLYVGTSKMLHAAINPHLFVMWDNMIQVRYGLLGTASEYAHVFLPKMQSIAKQAVNEVMIQENLSRADAIQSFTERCGKSYSLAKIIDEYNFTSLPPITKG